MKKCNLRLVGAIALTGFIFANCSQSPTNGTLGPSPSKAPQKKASATANPVTFDKNLKDPVAEAVDGTKETGVTATTDGLKVKGHYTLPAVMLVSGLASEAIAIALTFEKTTQAIINTFAIAEAETLDVLQYLRKERETLQALRDAIKGKEAGLKDIGGAQSFYELINDRESLHARAAELRLDNSASASAAFSDRGLMAGSSWAADRIKRNNVELAKIEARLARVTEDISRARPFLTPQANQAVSALLTDKVEVARLEKSINSTISVIVESVGPTVAKMFGKVKSLVANKDSRLMIRNVGYVAGTVLVGFSVFIGATEMKRVARIYTDTDSKEGRLKVDLHEEGSKTVEDSAYLTTGKITAPQVTTDPMLWPETY